MRMPKILLSETWDEVITKAGGSTDLAGGLIGLWVSGWMNKIREAS
jgi:hypothetical protein